MSAIHNIRRREDEGELTPEEADNLEAEYWDEKYNSEKSEPKDPNENQKETNH